MKTNNFIGLVFAISFLTVACVRADLITSYGTPDIEAYFTAAEGHSDWVFGGFYDYKKIKNNGNKAEQWSFDIGNVVTGETVYGKITASGMNGWSDGFRANKTDSYGTVDLSHNTAMITSMTFSLENFSGSFVDAFYFTLIAHDNSHDSWVYVSTTDSNGNTAQFKQQAIEGMFFGFILEEGYFTEFTITIAAANGSTKNNGGFDSLYIGLGDWGKEKFITPPEESRIDDIDDIDDINNNNTTVANPEPATLLILGLGLVGTAVTARRRTSK